MHRFVENNLIMGYEEKDKKVRMQREPKVWGMSYPMSEKNILKTTTVSTSWVIVDSKRSSESGGAKYSLDAIVKRLEEAEAEIASGDMSGWLTDEEVGVEIMRSLPWLR